MNWFNAKGKRFSIMTVSQLSFIGTSKTIDKRRPLLPEATDAAGNIKYGLVKPQQNPDFKGFKKP